MSGPKEDRRVVIQAHSLRKAATVQALLHGSLTARRDNTLLRTLRGSVVLAVVIMIVVLVTARIVGLLQQAGH